MHSFLITSGSAEQREKKAFALAQNLGGEKGGNLIFNPDFILVSREEKSSIGIEKVRQTQEKLYLKPFQSLAKIAVFEEAQFLTLEAQNALLKTLEEPPRNSYLILTCLRASLLLPTVVSRCALIELQESLDFDLEAPFHRQAEQDFLKILSLDYGARLDFIEERREIFSQKEEVLKIIDAWLSVLHENLVRRRHGQVKMLSRAGANLLLIKRQLLTSNVTARNLLEVFLLELPEKLTIAAKAH